MTEIKITIKKQIHYIEGDTYLATMEQNGSTIVLAVNIKSNAFLDMCEKLEGLKFRLEQLGHNVSVKTLELPDPNFESYEEAMEALEKRHNR